MARPPRFDPLNGWHHVMNRGESRRHIFADDDDRISFGLRLAETHDMFGVDIHAYCLMTTHFHLLVHCPDAGLSEAMQRLSSLYTRHTNDRHGRDGALFRGRFHSRLVTSNRYVLNAVRYIHRNPLDIDGIDDVARYRWSSHRTYLGFRNRPQWLRTDFVLSQFGGDRAEFDHFVRSSDHAAPSTTDRAHISAMQDAVRISLIEVTTTSDSDLPSAVRMLTLAALDQFGIDDPQSIANELGIPTRGAYRTALSRARAASQRPAMAAVVRRAVQLAA